MTARFSVRAQAQNPAPSEHRIQTTTLLLQQFEAIRAQVGPDYSPANTQPLPINGDNTIARPANRGPKR